MIPGHPLLSVVIPPVERLPFAVALVIVGLGIGYLIVESVLLYAKRRGY